MELWLNTRTTRLAVILTLFGICLSLILVNGMRTTYALHTSAKTAFLGVWVQFGTSTFIALLFLVVGALVWLYAQTRAVASLLLGLSFFMAVTFAVQTSATANDPLFSTLGQSSAALSLPLLFLLLLLFPKNHLKRQSALTQGGRLPRARRFKHLFLRGYILVVSTLSVLVVLLAIVRSVKVLPQWSSLVVLLYYLSILVGILSVIIVSYRMASTPQERQQLRLFVGGIVVAFSPFLLLTVLPLLLRLPPQDVISGQISTLTFCLIPASMGYSILRYQLMVLDTYVRRIIGGIVGFIALALLCYLCLAIGSLFFSVRFTLAIACVAGTITFLAPPVWIRAKALSDVIFFPDVAHYRRLLEQPVTLNMEKLTLDNAAHLLTLAAINTFGTPQACVLVLEANDSSYQVCPPLRYNDTGDETRVRLVAKVVRTLMTGEHVSEQPGLTTDSIGRLTTTSRPLLLQEVKEKDSSVLAHYLGVGSSKDGATILLAPIRVQGTMIAVLLLGERANQRQYAGPDFGIVQLLLERFSSVVETAYLTRELQASNTLLLTKNEQLSQAYERQKELDRLKDEFITIASHELRTPLTAVQGYVELLREYNGNDDLLPASARAEFLSKANRACDELTLLLGNMMSAGDVGREMQRMTLGRVGLQQAALKVTNILDAVLQQEHHPIRIAVDTSMYVIADEQRLGQVIRNLVVNAIKYSPAGTPIDISAGVNEGHITVTVRDYGKGIPPADQPRLFSRFVRLERDMNSPTRGSGLGLYISRQLVEAMHGTIWVESEGRENEGSAFKFSLPIAPANPTNEEAYSAAR